MNALAHLSIGSLLMAALFATAAIAGPVTVSPGATTGVDLISDRCPTFSWDSGGVAAGLDLVVYRVSESGSASAGLGAAAPVIERQLPGGATSWTPPAAHCLERGGSYAWSIRVSDSERSGDWAAPSLFRVAARPEIEEVEAAVRVLERYLGRQSAEAGAVAPVPKDSDAPRRSEPEASAPEPSSAAGVVSDFKVDGVAEADVVRLGDTGNNGVFWELQEEASNDMTFNYIGELVRITLTGQVGIGTPTPGSTLDVNGTATVTGFELPTGAGDGLVLTSDASGVATWQSTAGGDDGDWNVNGSNMSAAVSGNVGIGTTGMPAQKLTVEGTTQTDVLRFGDTGNNGIFWDVAEEAPSQDLVFSYLGERLRVGADGVLSVGGLAAASGTDLCISGSNELASCSSSLRYKERIRDLGSGGDIVSKLRPVEFKWRNRPERDLGFVAEEVAAIDPLLVTRMDGRIEGVKYRQLTAVLVKALQEQQERIELLEARLNRARKTEESRR